MIDSESFLQRQSSEDAPSDAVHARIKGRVMQRIAASAALRQAQVSVTASAAAKDRIWNQISMRIAERFSPAPALRQTRVRWIAAFAVVALLIQSSPSVFLSPTSVAKSQVLLIPTAGSVAIAQSGMWEEVREEVAIESGVRIRTYGGQASIVFHDDAVVRLDEDTIVVIHDTEEHIQQASEVTPTFTLVQGHVWMQGLVPSHVRGITAAVAYGTVTVHEGSVSLEDTTDGVVAVNTWNRTAFVSHQGETIRLVNGESTELRQDNVALVKKIVAGRFQEEWPRQNFSRDAVHRRYIAQMQHERRVAAAGILPTSTLYPVKRVAEKVDVLLTFDEEARVQKQLELANARLNEAAALVEDGEEEEVADALEDFRGTLLSVASGTGSDSVAHSLIKQSVSETLSDVTAALPGDQGYALKKAVLETTADLPDTIVEEEEIEAMLFVDTMEFLFESIDLGNVAAVSEEWDALQERIALLETGESVDPQLRKEARVLLERFAVAMEERRDQVAELDGETYEEILVYLPEEEVPVTILLSSEEIEQLAQSMFDRIYVYKMPQSRKNQVHAELTAIQGHNEEGRLLRALHRVIPEQSTLSDKVRRRIVQLRWQKAGEAYAEKHGDGGTEL